MKFSIKDFFSKCDQIRSFLQIWSHLLTKSLTENFIFCAVKYFNTYFIMNLSFQIIFQWFELGIDIYVYQKLNRATFGSFYWLSKIQNFARDGTFSLLNYFCKRKKFDECRTRDLIC